MFCISLTLKGRVIPETFPVGYRAEIVAIIRCKLRPDVIRITPPAVKIFS